MFGLHTLSQLTVAEFVLNQHVVILCPGGVVADQVLVRSQDSVGTHFTKSTSSENKKRKQCINVPASCENGDPPCLL